VNQNKSILIYKMIKLIGLIVVVLVIYMFSGGKIPTFGSLNMPKVVSENKLFFGALGGFTLCWFMNNNLLEGLGEPCDEWGVCNSSNCIDPETGDSLPRIHWPDSRPEGERGMCGRYLEPEGATCEERCRIAGINAYSLGLRKHACPETVCEGGPFAEREEPLTNKEFAAAEGMRANAEYECMNGCADDGGD